MFHILKDTQSSPFLLVHCCAKSGKAVPWSDGRNELADLQPTFNKGEGGSSLTIFVTECLQN